MACGIQAVNSVCVLDWGHGQTAFATLQGLITVGVFSMGSSLN